MPEVYQGKHVFRCGNTACIVLAYEERRRRGNKISGGLVPRDRCKSPESPCSTTVVADDADKVTLLALGYEYLYTLDNIVSE